MGVELSLLGREIYNKSGNILADYEKILIMSSKWSVFALFAPISKFFQLSRTKIYCFVIKFRNSLE